MFKTKHSQILYLLLSAVPLVLIAVFYAALPQEIPTHWGADGEMSLGNKNVLWIMGAVSLLLALLFMFLPKIEPLKENYEKFRDSYNTLAVVVQLFMLAMTGIALREGFAPGSVSMENIVIGAVGLLLIFLGNMLPKFQSSYFIGFRTPWALSHPDVWNKTQRLGGYCFCFTGIICLLLTVLPLTSEVRLVVLLVALLITCILPSVLSCYWFQKLPKDQQKKVFVEIKPGETPKGTDLSYTPKKTASKSSNTAKNSSGKKKKKKK